MSVVVNFLCLTHLYTIITDILILNYHNLPLICLEIKVHNVESLFGQVNSLHGVTLSFTSGTKEKACIAFTWPHYYSTAAFPLPFPQALRRYCNPWSHPHLMWRLKEWSSCPLFISLPHMPRLLTISSVSCLEWKFSPTAWHVTQDPHVKEDPLSWSPEASYVTILGASERENFAG